MVAIHRNTVLILVYPISNPSIWFIGTLFIPPSAEGHLSTLNKVHRASLPLSFILRIPFVLNEFCAGVLICVGVWAPHLSISH